MKKRVLFVDDEVIVLYGLRRVLRCLEPEWDLCFATSGREALEVMASSPVDVVVTDMRMPGMDGAELLLTVKERYPDVVRIILSGYSDPHLIFKSIGSTHQFLAKPCDPETVRKTISNAVGLRSILSDEKLMRVVSQLTTLPSLPNLYLEVLQQLQSPDVTLTKIGELISKDIGMTAKILQLVNSAFFGLSKHVTSPVQAARLLGLDTISTLILSVHIFSKFSHVKMPGRSLKQIVKHSFAVGTLAKAILQSADQSRKNCDDGFMAGMLHDIGILVLVENLPEQYNQAVVLAEEQKLSFFEAEQQILGTTHAAIGGYLLGLWGLPDAIVEAVAFHHAPSVCTNLDISSLTAVHVANVQELLMHDADYPVAETTFDLDYLQRIGALSQLPKWEEICRNTKTTEVEL